MYRFYSQIDFKEGEKITLPNDEIHHLKHVLRVKNGEKIEVVNGCGQLAIAIFDEFITIESIVTAQQRRKTILIQAYPQHANLELILEKCTEIGISDFYLFPSSKSPYKYISENKKSRCQKIIISALKQCKRLHLPKITFFSSIDEMHLIGIKVFLTDPCGDQFTQTKEDVAIIVGPESGFSNNEINHFINKLEAISVKLSNNILRCETAAIASSFMICS